MLCFCPDETRAGECQRASCSSDADCGGGLCASYDAQPRCGHRAFACQRPDDECLVDADCAGLDVCTVRDGRRVCLGADCNVGRPFLVANACRVAALTWRDDWSAGDAPRVEGLGAALRARLAAEWARAGQMEHASIAAFARFTLQLLALGAPPDLVADALRAADDERNHARLCFGLAGAFGGEPVGPAPLAVDGALDDTGLEAAVVTAVAEGCVGETLAALEAAEALAWATDAATRAVLATVVRDELSHAELAWRFVAWALSAAGRELRAAVERAFAEAIAARGSEAALPDDASSSDAVTALHFGVLSPSRKAALRRQALLRVVAPCAEAMLAGPSRRHEAARPRTRAGAQDSATKRNGYEA
jgi:hypothetical protein